jgi:hypothetical protein
MPDEGEEGPMEDLHEAYEDRRTALLAASNLLSMAPEDIVVRVEENAGAVVAFAELIHTGYFPTSPLLTTEGTS